MIVLFELGSALLVGLGINAKQTIGGEKDGKGACIDMKIVIIFLFLYLLTITLTVSLDLIMGMSLHKSLNNLWNPFIVRGGPEIAMTILLFLIWFLSGIFSSRNKNK